ncbi:MAG TPA: hypothetical protein PKE45_10135 [Caldilineaceae bacterium]|nr:hypothetical protein [Caldilineaceae bacterium]
MYVDAISGMGGYNLPVDAWGLDVLSTSSNKALEIPPGLSILSVSPRAWEIIEAKKEHAHRGWYYNLSVWKAYRDGAARMSWRTAQKPDAPIPAPATTTMATGLIAALRTSLKRILHQETLAGHWARYAWAQQVTRQGMRNLGFEPLVAEEAASFTVTTVRKRDDMESDEELREFLLNKYGFFVSGAGGVLAGNVLRIGHMGKASTPEYLLPFLLAVEDFVRTVKEVETPVGAGLVGLEHHPILAHLR